MIAPQKETHHNWIVRENFSGTDIYLAQAKTILNKATGFMNSYDFTLNPYRGCQYGCSYCYAAAFSPDKNRRQNWGNWVIVKENAAQILEKELARWQQKFPNIAPKIYLSSVTDPYQPLEVKRQLTRSLLKVMLAYQPTLVIQTRSPMIIRDIDLLSQFQRLRINLSIPTGSERVRKDFEPRSPSIKSRLQTINKLKYNIPVKANYDIRFSVTITPLLPTFPEDEINFIQQLTVVDRVVLQDFHPSNNNTLTASTRKNAIALKDKYAWWYGNNKHSYQNFKQKLQDYFTALLADVEIMEGKAGFGFD
ncbi:Radical SAM domain protein [Hyella patelloides LEGE 07179]|uniref:Radical SAM domain protein n=1 Tax=Hyella patelloides LEGE 07179 TaxID=945734 RepID=A0A563W5F7_9CYAN|nr:radical SAM protein [Hyella patelloides]VEP18918.1 Radical SAM domain protein [Hyella patelloides LEGE 07179]